VISYPIRLGQRVVVRKGLPSEYVSRSSYEGPNPTGVIVLFRCGCLTYTFEGVTYQNVRFDKPNVLDVKPVPLDKISTRDFIPLW